MGDERERILSWGRKLFPCVTRAEPWEKGCAPPRATRGCRAYRLFTDDFNCMAVAFIDPWNLMPWFQPTGATEMPRPQG
jgi:hypothetical protein